MSFRELLDKLNLDKVTDKFWVGSSSATGLAQFARIGHIKKILESLVNLSFLDLSDTPNTYGTAGQVPVINGTEDGIEFATVNFPNGEGEQGGTLPTGTDGYIMYYDSFDNKWKKTDIVFVDDINDRVGIGINVPTAELHVKSLAGTAFLIDGSGVNDILKVLNSGTVGIGETNPTTKLHVKSASGTALQVDGSSITGIFKVENSGDITGRGAIIDIQSGGVSDTSRGWIIMNATAGFFAFGNSAVWCENNNLYLSAGSQRIASFNNTTGLTMENLKPFYANQILLRNGSGGSNKYIGTATLNGITGVAVTTTQSITGSNIFLTSVNGVNNGILTYTIDSATQFTIYSSNALDNSIVNFVILAGW